MKAPRALAMAAVTAAIVGMGSVGDAAASSSGSIGPSDPSEGWGGRRFALGAVPAPGLCSQGKCDHFGLAVAVSSRYWGSHTGSISISISWKSATDNFDLYVYKGGQLQKSSTQALSTSEAVGLSSPSGTYQVLVVPVLVTDSGYSGYAKFSSEEKPPPSPPPGDGGGGGGSGSGGGGGGSGGGPSGSGGSEGSVRYFGPDPYTAPSYLPPAYHGGTVYLGPQGRTNTSSNYRAGSPSPTEPSGSATRTQPVAFTAPQLPLFVWLLLPLGMIILVAVAYAVFEPERETAEEPLPEPAWRSQQPTLTPAPIALAGLMVRTATNLGRTAQRGFAHVIARRRRTGGRTRS